MIGNSIHLRALEPADAKFVYELENNPEVWEVSNTLKPYSMFEIEQFILNSADIFTTKQLRLMMISNDDHSKAVGMIDLFDFDPLNKRAELGILVKHDMRGRGIANEALELMIRYAQNMLKLHQLYTHIPSDNEISIYLFENNGFIKTGIKKEWCLSVEGWKDEFLYQLIF